jgi:hypothetical protein
MREPRLLAKLTMELSGQDAEVLWQVPAQVDDLAEVKERPGEESTHRCRIWPGVTKRLVIMFIISVYGLFFGVDLCELRPTNFAMST